MYIIQTLNHYIHLPLFLVFFSLIYLHERITKNINQQEYNVICCTSYLCHTSSICHTWTSFSCKAETVITLKNSWIFHIFILLTFQLHTFRLFCQHSSATTIISCVMAYVYSGGIDSNLYCTMCTFTHIANSIFHALTILGIHLPVKKGAPKPLLSPCKEPMFSVDVYKIDIRFGELHRV